MADDQIKGQLASGEVLLIDTRQHWVAAIRYVIRPILIVGAALLLALVNQWLRFDRLGFINDIVHWIIVIALIVAIVWLPIDLVRWWSRRYVLTNRRAMRMEGVLRKMSMDSSLEQINDIMLSQSFLGRRLGYADLTLLTANASSDAYEQLLDGPQFKKAVLDAKEAIRSGHPLESLPEDFVVKGGTNAASLRAGGNSATGGSSNAAVGGGSAGAAVATSAAVVSEGDADMIEGAGSDVSSMDAAGWPNEAPVAAPGGADELAKQPEAAVVPLGGPPVEPSGIDGEGNDATDRGASSTPKGDVASPADRGASGS